MARLGEADVPDRDVRLVTNASAPIAHLAATVRLTGGLRRSQANLVNEREEERRRVHCDLHDDLAPTLAGQALLLDAASSTIGALARSADQVAGCVESILGDDIATAARSLSTSIAEEDGVGALVAAVERVLTHTNRSRRL